MVARWVAVVLIVAVVALVGVIAGAAIWGRVTTPSDGSALLPDLGAGTERLSGTAGPWSVAAELTRGAANELAIVIKIANAKGEPPDQVIQPAASVQMLDMAMGAQSVPLAPEQPGQWRGVTNISMNGRWTLEVVVDGERIQLPFKTTAP